MNINNILLERITVIKEATAPLHYLKQKSQLYKNILLDWTSEVDVGLQQALCRTKLCEN